MSFPRIIRFYCQLHSKHFNRKWLWKIQNSPVFRKRYENLKKNESPRVDLLLSLELISESDFTSRTLLFDFLFA